ncbi:MAG: DUF1513 domain-containing protein, partial [Caenispirillum sp.]|nr:DUF1513 domain-containing protein [Caenispirillum sp.]
WRPGTEEVAVFARRPGTFVLVADVTAGRAAATIAVAPGRHFYGHGTFSRDGRLLYAAENAYEDGTGVIGIYDADAGYTRIGEMAAGGVGPHDLRLMPDGTTMVVAVGGIQTHPDMARVKLNLDSMDPSLTYLDAATGTVLEQARQPEDWHWNSMRHLAVAPSGRVLCVQQWEGPGETTPPLVAVHDRGGPLRLLEAPPEIHGRMRNYCGSASLSRDGRIAAVSAPRGGLVTFWDMEALSFLTALDVPDGCGVAPAADGDGFVLSSGAGGVWTARDGALATVAVPADRRWDNHLLLHTAGPA